LNHTKIDQGKYSTSKDILQGTSVYSEKYHLAGKIDVFHIKKKSLMERKTHISEVYQGYVYQLYAQYFCLTEMGYQIEKLKLYSMDDNKVYEIPLPDEQTIKAFETFLDTYQHFSPASSGFTANPEKCVKCIYRELCDSAVGDVVDFH
jgi:CRISPR-associated protein Cas4